MHKKSFALIGAGAVGSHLATALNNSGHRIVQIISRNSDIGLSLAKKLNAKYSEKPEDLNSDISHLLLTLPDHAIKDVIPRIPKRDIILLHTSGSCPMEELKVYGTQIGVFYPLQSFSIESDPDWAEIPFFIEGSNTDVEKDLLNIVDDLGAKGMILDSSKRLTLHLAAVFASNFTNYMQGIAQELVQGIDLPIDVFKPLVAETVRKSFDLGADIAQTGPARRGDFETVKKHLEFLSCCPLDRELYKTLSDSIWDKYKK